MARVGLILPSSNRVVEDALRERGGALRWHVTRLRVRRVGLDPETTRQFEAERLAEAAELLADAAVDAIAWAGSAGAWTGIARERALAHDLSTRLGRPVTTTILAVLERLRGQGPVALLTPFTAAVQAAIRRELESAGITLDGDRSLGLESSLAMADVAPEAIRDAALPLIRPPVRALLILCTNLRGHVVADELARATGVTVVDSVAATLDAAAALALRREAA